MLIVYPTENHTTYENSTFIMGSVPPGHHVRFRLEFTGKPAETHLTPIHSTTGSFCEKIELHPGVNKIRIEEIKTLDSSTPALSIKTLTVISHPPAAILPESPPKVEPGTMKPDKDYALMPGDSFTVSCLVNPGATASVTLPGVIETPVPLSIGHDDGFVDNREMVFKELHQTHSKIPKNGYCQGTLTIPADAAAMEKGTLLLHITTQDGKTAEFLFPGKISVRSEVRPAEITVEATAKLKNTVSDKIISRTGPSENDPRLSPQLPGTQLTISGQTGEWGRAKLSGSNIIWIPVKNLVFKTPETPTQAGEKIVSVKKVDLANSGDQQADVVVVLMNGKPPLEFKATSNTLDVQFYQTVFRPESIQLAKGLAIIQSMQPQPLPDEVFQVGLTVPRLAGYDYFYGDDKNPATSSIPQQDTLFVRVKTLPKNHREAVIILDPGHGGSETGSMGPTGIAEKDLNLRVAKAFRKALLAEGFQKVLLTREADQELALEDRARFAREHSADIVLSLHHNALPDGRDPAKYLGACCFYYHDFSKPLADALQQSLVRDAGMNDYGVLHESFHMTRIHQSLAVLIEFGFFTHPADYDRLITPEFQEKATRALASKLKGIF